MLESAIYRGRVLHTRSTPRRNHFDYRVHMYLIDVDDPQQLVDRSPLMSFKSFNFVSFYPEDYFQRNVALSNNIKHSIQQHCQESFEGKVYLLTQLRRLGFVFNPVSFYFCFDKAQSLAFIVSEIENTPWGERHTYVHKMTDSGAQSFTFAKTFHVSPFLPMDMEYTWRFSVQSDSIGIQMHCKQAGQTQLHTSLALQKQPTNSLSLTKLAMTGILDTLKIPCMIYLQAFKLWLKKTPFFAHPNPASRKGL